MNREELKEIMPHREPMLLLDEAEVVDGKAFAKYKVRGDEFFLQGHFPGKPLVPGVIQLEMMAQSLAVLLSQEQPGLAVYTGIKEAKFKSPVQPGDCLEIETEITRKRLPFIFCKSVAKVNGKVAASAELSVAITEKI